MRIFCLAISMTIGAPAYAGVCAEELEVIASSVTYQTRMFKGNPLRRDATIKVDIRSSSTSAVSAIDLAIFLGASLQAVSETRPLTLPTSKYREFEDGGLAFRTELSSMIIGPKATERLTISRKALPLEEDVYAIHVVPAACKTVVWVGDAVVEAPAATDEGPPGIILIALGLVGLVTVVMILRQLR